MGYRERRMDKWRCIERGTDMQNFILLNKAVQRMKTNGDTRSRYTYVQIGKNTQLPVAILS